MANLDLKTDKGLLEACQRAEADIDREDIEKVAQFLERVHSTTPENRSGEWFVRLVWEENPLAQLGNGNYPLGNAYQDAGFRDDFAEEINQALPKKGSGRRPALNELVKKTARLARNFIEVNSAGKRDLPIAKTLRMLAALFPFDLTPLPIMPILNRVVREMDLPSQSSEGAYGRYAEKQRDIMDRLDEVLGSIPESDWTALATRRLLANRLGNLAPKQAPDTEAKLKPRPALERRKGLIAFAGLWDQLLIVVDYVNKKNPDKDELHAFMRIDYPANKVITLNTQINSIQREFNAIELRRNRYSLTDTGKKLLETKNPDALRDWLLTRILGPDHVLIALKKQAHTSGEVTELLKKVNPNWTTDYAPRQLVSWLRALGVVEKDSKRNLVLTERGRQWAERIHWEPEFLERTDPTEPQPAMPPTSLETILERFEVYREEEGLVFDAALVEALHLGLWANERRHFAVLTGLSGTGKTKLALRYGRALTGAENERNPQMCVVSVEPAWHDPSPLLGFVNPLNKNAYQSTDFVKFLVRATENPSEPYVAVLDEMNLSHPEQYLAPLLSAMERDAGQVELHTLDEDEIQIPQRILYPANLVFIGTVNMDETTMGLSDKVLDRAFTLEFWDVNVDEWRGWDKAELGEDKDKVKDALSDLMNALRSARLHFGWRVIEETVRFMERRRRDRANLSATDALDRVIYAKVLPKLRGDDSGRCQEALDACEKALHKYQLHASEQKVKELKQDLDQAGSFRFWR